MNKELMVRYFFRRSTVLETGKKAVRMALWVKVLATNPVDRSSIPRTQW